jgi:uncharacterized membrane protein (UPF0136 family)
MDNLRQPIGPPEDDLTDRTKPKVTYRVTILWNRLIIGILGILLPLIFIIGEAYFLRGGVHVRGSISAYYHSSMRDIFVAGLCVIGFFLATYLSGEGRTWDFRLSLVAGLAVLGVVFFPTTRPHLLPEAPRCGAIPMPDGCSAVQQQFGETLIAGIHFAFAAIFILSLAAICFVFASPKRDKPEPPTMQKILRFCGWVIVGAVAWAAIGGLLKFTIWELTPLYLAEVISVWAFAAAWLLKARTIREYYGPPRRDLRPTTTVQRQEP